MALDLWNGTALNRAEGPLEMLAARLNRLRKSSRGVRVSGRARLSSRAVSPLKMIAARLEVVPFHKSNAD
jgi:hypothetical protein